MTRTASHNVHRNSAHAVAGYAGLALVALGAALLVPLAVLPFYPQETGLAPGFIFPGVCAMLVGYLVYFFGARDAAALTLSRAEAAGVTVIIWISAIAVFAVPLVLSGVLTIPQAIFEATSGLTTTGLSVVDVAACPRIVLMHRGMMHYMGGVGLILVLTCIVSDSHGLKMYNAEGHTERLLSSTAGSARMVLVLYTGIILIGTVAYVIAGMPVFDAINISISAVSTGGFAVRPDSLASYGSIAIELITIILMIAGATNFLLNFMLLQGRFRAFARHAETAAFLGIIIAATAVVAALLFACGMEPTVPEALRVALFQTVSVMTSTGLQTIPDFGQLVPSILYVLVFLMIVGGEAGRGRACRIVIVEGIARVTWYNIKLSQNFTPSYARMGGRRYRRRRAVRTEMARERGRECSKPSISRKRLLRRRSTRQRASRRKITGSLCGSISFLHYCKMTKT